MVWEVVKILLINGLVIAACVAGALLVWRWLEDRREARRTRERAFQQYAAGAKREATYHGADPEEARKLIDEELR